MSYGWVGTPVPTCPGQGLPKVLGQPRPSIFEQLYLHILPTKVLLVDKHKFSTEDHITFPEVITNALCGLGREGRIELYRGEVTGGAYPLQ